MIRIAQLKTGVEHTSEELKEKAAKAMKLPVSSIERLEIVKQSLDARKKPEIYYSYSVDVLVKDEEKLLKRLKNPQVTIAPEENYRFPVEGKVKAAHRPVIIGSGPAGLFCAYLLAENGYRPILLERGACVEERKNAVDHFWETGELDLETNVQFGEGGAGTFSDGKLNTLVKDKDGRNREVLRILVSCGAPDSILYENKPHIGTDVLIRVVAGMREQIRAWGGEVRFLNKVTDIRTDGGKITGVMINSQEFLSCETAVLAIGHSARDTFAWLLDREVSMEAKSFAVGLRVEHRQDVIDKSQYGKAREGNLPAASYKLTAQAADGRGVYTFCMCPGGYVVDASSEPGRLAVNGMSYHDRAGANANSAVIVSVTPEDYLEKGPLAGIAFQRMLEERAYQAGNGKIPVQRLKDFKEGIVSRDVTGLFPPAAKGAYTLANVRSILPEELNQAFLDGIEQFGRKIKGFNDDTTLLSGIESRTSSPVRIWRDESFQSNLHGLYPCGEGAGYAGGITSAAMDGMKTAEKIASVYAPF